MKKSVQAYLFSESLLLRGVARRALNITAIIAADQHGCIGVGSDIPWKCSPDLKRFKRLTTGHVLVMGAKTWIGLCKHAWKDGLVLPGRDIAVVYEVEPYLISHVRDEAELSNQLVKNYVASLMLRERSDGLVNRPAGRFVALPVLKGHGKRDPSTLAALLDDLSLFAKAEQTVFIAGGAKTYELFAPVMTHVELSQIRPHVAFEVDEQVFVGDMFRSLIEQPKGWTAEEADAQSGVTATYYSYAVT